MSEHVTYRLTPRARVSAGRGAEVQETRPVHHVLPGATVRGALGYAFWQSPTDAFEPTSSPPARQDAFDRLFGQLVVREAVPEGAWLRALSQVTHKYRSRDGVQLEGRLDLAAGPLGACPVCGAAFASPRGWRSADGTGEPLDRCADCGSVFEPERGGWGGAEALVTASTRTALTNGRARTGQLFTRPAVTRMARFTGALELRDPDAVPAEARAWLTGSRRLSVGGQKSTLGRVEWSAEPAEPPAPPTGDTVVLQLHSPAILLDDRGLPSLDLVSALRAVPGAGEIACRPWVRPTQVTGWHGIAGVPKPVEWALEAGSTAVLRGWDADALTRLTDGLGVRRLEGYGHVVLIDPAALPRFTAPTATSPHGDDRVTALLARVPSTLRGQVRNGLLKAARNLATRQENGASAEEFAAAVTDALSRPWVSDLTADVRDGVRELLGEPDLRRVITLLNAEKDRS